MSQYSKSSNSSVLGKSRKIGSKASKQKPWSFRQKKDIEGIKKTNQKKKKLNKDAGVIQSKIRKQPKKDKNGIAAKV